MARTAWPRRSSVLPGAIQITERMFVDIDRAIRSMESSKRKFQFGMNTLVQLLAKTSQGIAQEKSRGIVDPRMTSGAAWRIPVRRISMEYYHGWKVKRIRHGAWLMYNDSREAYFIEYGIHTSNRRVRRPIAKLTLLATMNRINSTGILTRFNNWVFNPGRYSVQSPPVAMFGAGSTGPVTGGYVF